MLDGGEVGWHVIGSDATLIVVKDHVHRLHLIRREQKYSLPSSATSRRPPRHWKRVSGPAASTARVNRPSNAAGEIPASIRRM